MITKRILDLGVSLTVGELLVSAPAVEKQLTKAITTDEAIQFRVNSLNIDDHQATTTGTLWALRKQKCALKIVPRS